MHPIFTWVQLKAFRSCPTLYLMGEYKLSAYRSLTTNTWCLECVTHGLCNVYLTYTRPWVPAWPSSVWERLERKVAKQVKALITPDNWSATPHGAKNTNDLGQVHWMPRVPPFPPAHTHTSVLFWKMLQGLERCLMCFSCKGPQFRTQDIQSGNKEPPVTASEKLSPGPLQKQQTLTTRTPSLQLQSNF